MGDALNGNGNRYMILGMGSPDILSSSVAVTIEKASAAVSYLAKGLTGAARSLSAVGALDFVAKTPSIEAHKLFTGWKYFENLMDAGCVRAYDEESLGTGSDHRRKKDEIFAVLCWLPIVAMESEGKENAARVQQVLTKHT